MSERWITTAEAAELSQYHPDHIRRLLRTGEIEGRKWGTVWQVNRESLLDYLAEQKAKGERRGPKGS